MYIWFICTYIYIFVPWLNLLLELVFGGMAKPFIRRVVAVCMAFDIYSQLDETIIKFSRNYT